MKRLTSDTDIAASEEGMAMILIKLDVLVMKGTVLTANAMF